MARGRVLIVDDTPLNVQILSDILEAEGYSILAARDGEEGLRRALDEKPDVVLVDLVMPRMTGLEVLEELNQCQAETVAVLTTAYGSEEVAIEALRRGVRDYIINKEPFDRQEVVEVVRRAVTESRLRQENARLARELATANQRLQDYTVHLEETVQKLQAANEKLKELDEMKSNFLSMISHELRTPLTVAKGFIDLVEGEQAGKISDEARGYLRQATEHFGHLARMIEDLLDISRMDAGRYRIEPQHVYPHKLVTSTVRSLHGEIFRNGLTLEQEVERDLPLIYADPARIGQVVSNLVQNAIKFTPAGGTITVGVRQTPEDILFWVKDTGMGIPARELDRVFDRFYQVDRASHPRQGGVGLGLTICKEIVRLHGGKIWIESEVGRGSTFFFSLPKNSP